MDSSYSPVVGVERLPCTPPGERIQTGSGFWVCRHDQANPFAAPIFTVNGAGRALTYKISNGSASLPRSLVRTVIKSHRCAVPACRSPAGSRNIIQPVLCPERERLRRFHMVQPLGVSGMRKARSMVKARHRNGAAVPKCVAESKCLGSALDAPLPLTMPANVIGA
jgi:hypothetical protein